MEIWDHNGKLYEVNSYYSLPDNAWQYELVGLTGAPGTGPSVAIVIPDATPGPDPFTPTPAGDVVVSVAGGVTPWSVLQRLLDLVESSGDIVAPEHTHVTADDKILSNNIWCYDGRRFEVNSFHAGNRDTWCYELYGVTPDTSRNDYVEVEVPDANPDGGPFVPGSAERVTVVAHGEWDIPWPIFQRFIGVIAASGDIVCDQTTGPAGTG